MGRNSSYDLTNDESLGDETPKMTVIAIVPIITQHKVGVVRYCDWGNKVIWFLINIFFLQGLIVNVHFSLYYLNCLPWQTDDTLDV